MPTVPSGVSYSRGVVYNPSGNVLLEFEPSLNPELLTLFNDLGALVGLEVDITGLPNSFILDGVTYNVNQPEDQDNYQDLLAALQTELGVTEQAAKNIVRPLYRGLKENFVQKS